MAQPTLERHLLLLLLLVSLLQLAVIKHEGRPETAIAVSLGLPYIEVALHKSGNLVLMLTAIDIFPKIFANISCIFTFQLCPGELDVLRCFIFPSVHPTDSSAVEQWSYINVYCTLVLCTVCILYTSVYSTIYYIYCIRFQFPRLLLLLQLIIPRSQGTFPLHCTAPLGLLGFPQGHPPIPLIHLHALYLPLISMNRAWSLAQLQSI